MGPISAKTGLGRIRNAGILENADMGPNFRLMAGYTFVYTLEGTADYHDANGLKRTIVPGDLIIVFPNLPHNYNASPGSRWKQIYVMVESPMLTLWKKHGYIHPAHPIHHAEPIDFWFKKFLPLYKNDQSPKLKTSLVDLLQFQQILAQILLAEESDGISEYDLDWAQNACQILERFTEQRKPIPKIARKLGMSYESFRKRFTRIMGLPPTQYQNKRLIDQACRLMQETDYSNKEIAYRLNFCDEFHFSHRFKQITGRSPKEFRRTLPIRTTARGT
ncbi:MAG: AraC family transcriptional regulator [Phycisphaerae bacterium]|nr:AraC family transcriptional regulator [Phycisphaerae bacterium]